MNREKIYMQIFNFKKLFIKLFLKNNDNKLLKNPMIYYLPKTF